MADVESRLSAGCAVTFIQKPMVVGIYSQPVNFSALQHDDFLTITGEL